LEGHEDIVNCIIGHPTQPMIASSGIDNVVKLWQNIDNYPSESVLQQRENRQKELIDSNNNQRENDSDSESDPVCVQQ